MYQDLVPLAGHLGAAIAAVLLIAALVGRKRRRRDPLRFFTWPDKRRLVTRAGGRCEHKSLLWRRCPRRGTEADHIVPWSRGGPTELWNGQLLCHWHNARKSNTMPGPLYRWRLERRRKNY